jgi:hypothetical protein
MAEFDEITLAADGNLEVHLGATTQLAEGHRVKWDNSQRDPRGGEREFDVIVLTVGFGIETGVREGSTTSYWRNDSINQPRPGITSEKPDLYLVSGTGDGGLIDLLRCRIKSFNHGRIIDDLINADDPGNAQLIQRLRTIVKTWSSRRKPERNWLFKEYERLSEDGLLKELGARIKPRLRSDTAAILNGRERTFSEVLGLSNASMFNTLLTYLLYQSGNFTYVYGGFRRDSPEQVMIEQAPVPSIEPPKATPKNRQPKKKNEPVARTVSFKPDHLTVRHGVDRYQSLLSAGVSEIEIDKLRRRQSKESDRDTIEPLWPAGWWYDNIHLKDWDRARIEFVSPATLTIASTFVSTVSDILIQLGRERPGRSSPTSGTEFRITLHRVVDIRGEKFFQQVAYYAGTRTSGSPGRVFELETGLVGLVCRKGAPIVARKTDKKVFQRLWEALALTKHGAKKVDNRVQAILACPFFALSDDGRDRYVCMVLFIDSERVNFFSQEILKTVYAASAGFVHSLDGRAKSGDVRFATRSYRGYKPKLRAGDRQVLKEYNQILQVLDQGEFQQFVDELTFDKVKSFDAELQLPKLGRKSRQAATSPA